MPFLFEPTTANLFSNKGKYGFLASPAAALNIDFRTGVLDPRITFSRASLGTYVDSTGNLTWSPNNFLLNSEVLSTQSITLNARTYILSFKGTGSVDLSGTYTATLAGTGSTNRVYLRFTTTSGGALTLTVTGTVTEAQLEAVTYQTTPRAYVATTTAIYYGPRFDYDPVTFDTNGLLIEESRTNLALYSSDYTNAAWTKRGGTAVLAAQTTAPDGTLTGFSMYDSAASAGTYIRQTPTLADNTTYTSSIYVKKQALSSIRLICYAKSSTADSASTTINFDTGVVTTATTGTVSGTGGGAVDVGNGWWRIWTSLNSSTGAVAIPFQLGSLNNPTGDGTSSVYVWGAQLEAGTFTTSYIPTAASAISRAIDNVTMTGTDFTDWYNQSEGTLVVDYYERSFSVSHQAIYLMGASTNERLNFGINSANNLDVQVVSAGSDTFAGNSPSMLTGNRKIAFAYAANNAGVSVNGSAVTNDGSVTLPTGLASLYFGSTAVPNGHVNSTIKRFTYFNTRLPNSTLQQLSN